MNKHTLFAGILLIITIFVSLCIMIFSMMTVRIFKDEKRLLWASVDNEGLYSIACNKADNILDRLVNKKEFNIDGVKLDKIGDTIIASYKVEINNDKYIDIEVKIRDESFEILKWQQEYCGDWEINDILDIWTGN